MNTQPALRRVPIVLLLSIVILSVLSLARLNQSLWLDEGSSVWFARLPLSTLLESLCDPHPPGYYLLLKTWLILGDSEAWLRVPSFLAALLAVLLTYQIGKEHGGRTYATLAAILLALQPLQAWYGSEVRMYAVAQAAGLLLVWLGWRVIDSSSQRLISIAYLLVAVIALGIDYTVFLAWGLLQLVWMARGFPHAQRWLVLQAFALLPIAIGLLTTNQLDGLRQTYQPIFLAVQANSVGLALTPSNAALILQVTMLLISVWCLALAWHWRRNPFLGSPLARSAVVALWMVLVIVAIVPRGFSIKRVIVVMLPYLALATAYALTRWPKTVRQSVIAVEVFAAALSLVTLQREPWRGVINDVLTTTSPSIVWVDDLAVPIFDYYARRASSADRTITYAPLFGRDLPQMPELQPISNGRLTIITNETRYRRLAVFLPATFYAQYKLLTEQHAPGIGVGVYQRRTQPDLTATPPASTQTDEWGLSMPSPLASCQP